MQTTRCDIIVSGSGMAGLSLLYRALKSGLWINDEIIVIDKADKDLNDKTWSFWKKEPTEFDDLIHSTWDNLLFFSNQGETIHLNNGPYSYNSIRSIDFYTSILTWLKQFPNITFINADVDSISSTGKECSIVAGNVRYISKFLFNSIYKKPELQSDVQYFLQHFKGIKIKTKKSVDVTQAYLMDFRTTQENGTTFFYTLPTGEYELFLEYTLFSKELLQQEQYDLKIRTYLKDILKIEAYEVLEEEFGVIPMTDHHFKRFDGNIVHIGTMGGDTRASTGYTFINTQKTIDKILHSYRAEGHPFFKEEHISKKHQLYDATLLKVLSDRKYKGHQLFYDLFNGTPAYHIFAFLDAETSIFQDFRIMKSLKIIPFFKSFIIAVFKKIKQ